jgi:hypothetical protein
VNAVLAGLRRIGLDPPLPTRSQLVRSRLAERYGLSAQDMEVTLARLTCPDHAGVGLELFFFPRSARALTSWIVENERHRELESHLAVRVLSPDQALLEQLLDAFRRQGLFLEGGGHLAGHGDEGSSTTLYFVTTGPAPGVPHRVELCCPGDFSSLLARHQIDAEAVRTAYAA